MSLHEVWEKFISNVQQTSWQEWVSTITQIASVWYARKNNILVFPTGIIGVLLAAWLYFFNSHPPLYADGTLNIYYFIMSVYGWYNWVQKKDAAHLLILLVGVIKESFQWVPCCSWYRGVLYILR